MNLYGSDYSSLSMFDLASFSDPTLFETLSSPSIMFSSPPATIDSINEEINNIKNDITPPKRRHDGSSPLPLGMDWSPPPRIWDGRNSVWPGDFHSGWSYCVTVPSWTVEKNSIGSDHIVYYRVLIGVQSPQRVTTTRGILRRFSDFLKLSSDLKKAVPEKKLPPSPPKGLMKIKSRELMEDRRGSLEDWISKVLSDIDLSRSAPIAIFLELEAAARSSFDESSLNVSESYSSVRIDLPSNQNFKHSGDDAHTSSFASDLGNDSSSETSDLGRTQWLVKGTSFEHGENAMFHGYSANPVEVIVKDWLSKNDDHRASRESVHDSQERNFHDETLRANCGVISSDILERNLSRVSSGDVDQKGLLPRTDSQKITSQRDLKLSSETPASAPSSARPCVNSDGSLVISSSENLEAAENFEGVAISVSSDLQLPNGMQMAFPSDEQHKMNRVFSTMEQRLTIAKTDVEDLIARLNQELAVRQYLTTKVKDLEVELETTKENGKENLQHAISAERERFNQMQWDVEELRRKCMEMELKLKSEQDERANSELKISSIAQENETLQRELEVSREQLANFHAEQEELEMNSKADMKLLVKEVRSLRTLQSELKQELSRLANEKTELKSILQKEKKQRENAQVTNSKLLQECEILCSRLEECSISFLIEEENKLTLGSPSTSEAIDILATYDNRFGLLVAEAQLLAQDVENGIANTSFDDGSSKTDNEMRKMLTGVFVDNAKLRKHVNSVIRCALSAPDEPEEVQQDSLSERTVLSTFLEK